MGNDKTFFVMQPGIHILSFPLEGKHKEFYVEEMEIAKLSPSLKPSSKLLKIWPPCHAAT